MSKYVFCLLFLLFLPACIPEKTVDIADNSDFLPTQTQIEHTKPVTPTLQSDKKTPTQSITATATGRPTRTTTNTPTLKLTPSTTPTFDATQIVTVTPASLEVCPEQNANIQPPNFESISDKEGYFSFSENYLAYLNSGGKLQSLSTEWQPDFLIDLTNDSIPEQIFQNLEPYFVGFYIFGCKDGEYQSLSIAADIDYSDNPEVIAIEDANLNGVPEVIVLVNKWTQALEAYGVFEWNGRAFSNLVADDQYSHFGEISWWGPLEQLEIHDIDANGTPELIWKWQEPVWDMYWEDLPWRQEIHTYMWNGSNYIFYQRAFSPPEYRYQAVLDGDLKTLEGAYDLALDFYQMAISDNELDWWTLERRNYEQENWPRVLRPTPIASLMPDPNEYPNIAAYAYYRIMLIEIVNGQLAEAQGTYDTLQELYPSGQPGYSYAEMASQFWHEYQISENVAAACSEAITYAQSHPEEIFRHIGYYYEGTADYHGYQSRYSYYDEENICPFK